MLPRPGGPCTDETLAQLAAQAFIKCVLPASHVAQLKHSVNTKYGHYFMFGWGLDGETADDHIVGMLISVQRRLIWWLRCC